MMTIQDARDEAVRLAAAGYAAVVIHAPTHRDDWDDDDHAYTYQPAVVPPGIGETVVETFPAAGTPAYLRATPADVLAGWQEAYDARTAVERELIAECHARATDAGCSIGLVLMEAERYWRGPGRLVEPRRWRSRANACRRMLDHAASR
jgi:hypothetical protein